MSLPRGEATLCIVPGYPGENPFGEAWLDLARLVLPAFKAASRELQRRQRSQARLVQALDRMTAPS